MMDIVKKTGTGNLVPSSGTFRDELCMSCLFMHIHLVNPSTMNITKVQTIILIHDYREWLYTLSFL
jgi:hypothetical protein